jgi:4-hydroxybenzoate polyprenyltransferase
MYASLNAILLSLRPHQWYKNLIIFIGLIFSNNLFTIEMWPNVLAALVIFCLLSGSIYIINDIKDMEQDRLHPTKKYRPIASGSLSPKLAAILSVTLIAILLLLSFYLNMIFIYTSSAYLLMNLFYTFYLKNFALVDVMVISIGFVLRAVAGCISINIRISPWLIFCVFLMALVLAFGKRRHELSLATNSRRSLSGYTEKMVDNMLCISAALLLMSYALYTFDVNIYMMATIPFAFFGIFRFLQLVYLNNFGENAEMLVMDRISIFNLIFWVISVVIIIYGGLE